MSITHTTTATEWATAKDFKILERLTINEWPETKKKKLQENNQHLIPCQSHCLSQTFNHIFKVLKIGFFSNFTKCGIPIMQILTLFPKIS